MKKPNENDILETALSIAEKRVPGSLPIFAECLRGKHKQLWAANILFPRLFGWRRQYAGFGFGVAEKGDSRE